MKVQTLQQRKTRKGYVMLVSLILLALLTVLGSSTLNIAGIDQRIAYRSRQHMVVLHTSSAGTEDARHTIQSTLPTSEGFDQYGTEDTAVFITKAVGESEFGGLAYYSLTGKHNLGVYQVDAIYHRCGNPPPGYSTEQGRKGFRSDYWEMESIATLTDAAYINENASLATTSAMIRMVMRGGCKVR